MTLLYSTTDTAFADRAEPTAQIHEIRSGRA
jgi:hypothetical protein